MSRVRLHVVTGKGGVGKSTVCAAIALASARRGLRTLAIEMPQRAGLCRIFGAALDRPARRERVAPNLELSYFDGAAALSEYLGKVVPVRRLIGVVLDHPLYRAFAHAAPGVQELMAIGKVRDELRRRERGRDYWDAIVLDAGATGHALQLLRMPAAAASAFAGGLVHREASRIVALLRDPAVSAVHVVATPEEMPLREAEHAISQVRGELAMPLGAVFVNQCRAPAPDGVDAAIATLGRRAETVAAVLGRVRGWERIQEHGIAALERATGAAVVRLPRLLPASERDHAEDLANYVAEAVL